MAELLKYFTNPLRYAIPVITNQEYGIGVKGIFTNGEQGDYFKSDHRRCHLATASEFFLSYYYRNFFSAAI